MKSIKNEETYFVIEKLLKIMNDKDLKQATIAEYAKIDPSQMSKILNGSAEIHLWQIVNITTNLDMPLINFFTYPDVYIKAESQKTKKISLEINVTDEEFDQLGLTNKFMKLLEKQRYNRNNNLTIN